MVATGGADARARWSDLQPLGQRLLSRQDEKKGERSRQAYHSPSSLARPHPELPQRLIHCVMSWRPYCCRSHRGPQTELAELKLVYGNELSAKRSLFSTHLGDHAFNRKQKKALCTWYPCDGTLFQHLATVFSSSLSSPTWGRSDKPTHQPAILLCLAGRGLTKSQDISRSAP